MPSDILIEMLSELHLASPQAVSRCEASVRRLCHDLPDFDTVWLDALVQQNVVTKWQAEVLQNALQSPADSGRVSDLLRAGDFLLQQPLGEQTFLAVSQEHGRLAVLRRVPAATELEEEDVRASAWKALLDRLDQLRATAPQSIELPRVWIEGDQHHHVAAGYTPGYSLEELVIRGGRLPWQAVAEIGRQLLEAVTWLESGRLYHGHILLRNIRINAAGHMCLVNPFAHHLESPYLSFRSDLRLEDVECTAPELVSTGRMVDSQSELYSVGCVLWHLLTGRSVFLSTDPVTRLSRAAERDITDPRSIVPDCPDWLAEQLLTMTRRTPELRPESALVASHHWNARAPRGLSASRRILRQMPDRNRAPRVKRRSSSMDRWKALATVSAMLLCFVGYSIHRGILPMPLQLGGSLSAESQPDNTNGNKVSPQRKATITHSDSDGLLRMPAPDAGGVVLLQSGRAYRAADIEFEGQVYIEATGDAPAVIQVADDSWTVKAREISLSDLQIESDSDVKRSLFTAQCKGFKANHTLWQANAGAVAVEGAYGGGVSVSFTDNVFQGVGNAVQMDGSVITCEFGNCLCTVTGAVVRVNHDRGAFPVVRTDRLTVSQSNSLMDLIMGDTATVLMLQVECSESVFATSSSTGGLLRIAGPEKWEPDKLQVLFTAPNQGNGAILSSEVNPVIYLDRSLSQMVALKEEQIENRSLMLVDPIFSASGQRSPWAGFQLIDFDGPKLSPQLPGVDITRLPVPVNPQTESPLETFKKTGEE